LHQVLSTKDLDLAAKQQEIDRLGANVATASGEAAQLRVQLQGAMQGQELAEARLASIEAAFMRASQEAAAWRAKVTSAESLRASDAARSDVGAVLGAVRGRV
jgi:hypothetical protein